jgi:hypothetical protein
MSYWKGYTSSNYRPRSILALEVENEADAVKAVIARDHTVVESRLKYDGNVIKWQPVPVRGELRISARAQFDGFTAGIVKDTEIVRFRDRNVEITYMYYVVGVEETKGNSSSGPPQKTKYNGGTDSSFDAAVTYVIILVNGAYVSSGNTYVGDLPVDGRPYRLSLYDNDVFVYDVFLDDSSHRDPATLCLPARQLLLLNILGLLTYYLPKDEDALLLTVALSLGHDRCDPKLSGAGLIAGIASRLIRNIFNQ